MHRDTPLYYFVCAKGHRSGQVYIVRFRRLEAALRAVTYARSLDGRAYMGMGAAPSQL